MAIRAKMRCNQVQYSGNTEVVDLNPVYSDDPADPNHVWSEATPAGALRLYISNPAAQGYIKVQGVYVIDIVETH